MLEDIEIDPNTILPLKPATSHYTSTLHEAIKLRLTAENLKESKIQTIPQLFHESCQKYKDSPALAYESSEKKPGNNWTIVTYGEYEQHVKQAALVLLYLGVKPHSSIATLAFNCPECFYVELATVSIGAVLAGMYISNSTEAVYHIMETSDAIVCLVDDSHQMSKVRAIKSRLKQLHAVIQLNAPFDDFVGKEEGYYRWSDLFGMQFSPSLHEELLFRERDVAANECALLVFTSGTMGMPKGVMISHDGLLFCSRAVNKLMPQQTQEKAITYLPLSHIAAQQFDIFMALENGSLLHFANRNALKGSLVKTLVKAKPTFLLGVPRIYEKIQEEITQTILNSSGLTKLLITMGRNLMERYHLDKMENKPTSTFRYWLASKIVHRIKVAMGLEEVKSCFMGGAPVIEELKKFYLSLDLPLIDVFGMSETSGGITYNFDRPNLKTVGKPIPGVEIKIYNPNESGEGEILIRGRCNFMGYLKDMNKTLETVTEDGWIRTGDIGYTDNQNNLYISGRLKELIITTGGENIPPTYIEELIKWELPCISNAMVVGDHRKYLTVLLTLKTDIDLASGYPLDTLTAETIHWLESYNVHYTHLSDLLKIKLPENLQNFDPNTVEINCDAKVYQALEEGIKRYNQRAISNAQKVQYFTVLPHDFSIPTDELGPTLKLKRNFVSKKYAKIIEKMYDK